MKPIIKFSMFFLPESPGFCLMLQTDGAEEFQVLADDILVSSYGSEIFSSRLNPIVNHACLSIVVLLAP